MRCRRVDRKYKHKNTFIIRSVTQMFKNNKKKEYVQIGANAETYQSTSATSLHALLDTLMTTSEMDA